MTVEIMMIPNDINGRCDLLLRLRKVLGTSFLIAAVIKRLISTNNRKSLINVT